jgi:large subunit ribosomal protein L22
MVSLSRNLKKFQKNISLINKFNSERIFNFSKKLFMENTQSVRAVAKYIRMSPHKIRRVLDQIRGRSYQEALMILEFLPYNAGGPIWQVVHSAAANAKHNYGLDKKKLIIDEIFADEGPKLKRIRPRAQGRAYKILKPTCHITVVMKAIN